MPEVDVVTPESPAEDPGHLADHAAEFAKQPWNAPPKPEPPADDLATVLEPETKPEKPVRHRAASQKASAEEVEQINALTKELREAEAELLKVKPDAKAASPRLVTLRRQIQGIKAELAEAQPKPATPTVVAQPGTGAPVRTPSLQPFTESEPTIEQFANEADPYAAWTRALARYDRKKETFEAQQAYAQQQAQAQTAAQQAADAQLLETARARVQAFQAAHPDYAQKVQPFLQQYGQVPELLGRAIQSSDKAPDLVYYFADHPQEFEEHLFDAFNKPADALAVAVLQRRLLARLAAVPTGSAPSPVSSVIAPRPPNPVRTAPSMPRTELPGDGSSLRDHAQAFGRKRR